MAVAFWRRAEQDPTWTALIEPDGTRVPAGELLARVNQLTHVLRALGLRPGEVERLIDTVLLQQGIGEQLRVGR